MSEERWEIAYPGSCVLSIKDASGGTQWSSATLFVNDDGLHVHMPTSTWFAISSTEFTKSLNDDTVSFAWSSVTGAEFGTASVVVRLNQHESFRFTFGPADVEELAGILEAHDVPTKRGLSTIGRMWRS